MHIEIFLLHVDIFVFSFEDTQRLSVIKDFCLRGVDKRRILNLISFLMSNVKQQWKILNVPYGIQTCPSQNASHRTSQREKNKEKKSKSRIHVSFYSKSIFVNGAGRQTRESLSIETSHTSLRDRLPYCSSFTSDV